MKDYPNPGYFIVFALITAVLVGFHITAEDPETGDGGLTMPSQPGLSYKQKVKDTGCMSCPPPKKQRQQEVQE